VGAVWTVVVAGGAGSRFGGDVPKQYLPLGDRRVLDYSLAVARFVGDGVVLVVAGDFVDRPEPLADVVVAGGPTRSASVRAGLAAVPADGSVDVVVVHDAARPLASPALFAAVVGAVEAGADAAIPGVPVTDTVKRVARPSGAEPEAEGEGLIVVVETLARESLVAVQTPQAFALDVLRAAHAGGGEATDDAALVEAAGGRVLVVPGEPENRKLTTAEDLAALVRHLDTLAAGTGEGGE
jgi:2-C-methyl-D-erythritol 4-phosphate cytidylyltransferase